MTEATTEPDLSNVDEPGVVDFCTEEFTKEAEQFPEFAEHIDDIDYFVCPRAELIEAIRQAPTKVLRQVLFAIYSYRINAAMISGRSFF